MNFARQRITLIKPFNTFRSHGGTNDLGTRPDFHGGLHPLVEPGGVFQDGTYRKLASYIYHNDTIDWLLQKMRVCEHASTRINEGKSSSASVGASEKDSEDRWVAYDEEVELAYSMWRCDYENMSGTYKWMPRQGTEEMHKSNPLLRRRKIKSVQWDVLDLGAGASGHFLQSAVRRGEQQLETGLGFSVAAVEPLTTLRSDLESAVESNTIFSGCKQTHDVQVFKGRADKLPFPDSSVHSVVAAQNFEWFATVPSMFEISRVLPIGGFFGLIWNQRDVDAFPWISEIDTLEKTFYRNHPELDQSLGKWREPWENFLGCYFSMLSPSPPSKTIDWLSPDQIVNITRNKGKMLCIPEDEINGICEDVQHIIAKEVESKGKSFVDDDIVLEVPYWTEAYCCTLIDKT